MGIDLACFSRHKLNGEVCFSGVGLHSGNPCSVRVSPHEGEGTFLSTGGSVWRLSDGSPKGDGRCTLLSFPDGQTVLTVEHLLGAVAGLGLDGINIEVVGGEVPSLDGSAGPFVKGLLESGIRQEGEFSPIEIPHAISLDDTAGEKSIVAIPSKAFRITYVIDYQSTAIGTQCLSLDLSRDNFVEDIASCRTFALMEEVSKLRDMGLSLGGSLENAVVVDGMEVLAKGGLRYRDEFVRHKILDLIGDLSLLGRPLAAHVIAIRAGHSLHHGLAEIIKQYI